MRKLISKIPTIPLQKGKPLKVLSLFNGCSGAYLALEQAGFTIGEYYSSEIDKFAKTITQKNYPNVVELGDINDWRKWSIDWGSIDFVIAGSPCQGFSSAGQLKGFEDPRSKLFFVLIDIVEFLKSKKVKFPLFVENVSMQKHERQIFDSFTSLNHIEVNSSLFLPQNRVRLYWFNWQSRNIEQSHYDVNDFFEGDGFPSSSNLKRIVKRVPIFGTLTANYHKGIRSTGRPTISLKEGHLDEDKSAHRMLTPEECELIQGFPRGFTEGVSKTQRYTMLGNSYNIYTVSHLLQPSKSIPTTQGSLF